MPDNQEFALTDFIKEFFNRNAAFFNTPESEKKVLQTIPFSGARRKDLTGVVAMETLEVPVMENPKHFFRFYSRKRLQLLFDACPESAAKLGPRPWKYILMYSPEYAEHCPCLKDFSAEEKEQILLRRPELETYFH